MKPGRLLLLTGLACVLLLLLGDDLAAQCAMCKETVDSDKAGGGDLADGISKSILFMLALPFTVLGGFGLVIWSSYRKAGAAARPD